MSFDAKSIGFAVQGAVFTGDQVKFPAGLGTAQAGQGIDQAALGAAELRAGV